MEESWFDREVQKNENEGFERTNSLRKDRGIGASIIESNTGPQARMIEEEDSEEEYDDEDLNIDRPNVVPPKERDMSMSRELDIQNISIEKESPIQPLEIMPEKPKRPDPNQKMTKKVFTLNLIGVIIGFISSSLLLYFFYRAYKSFAKDYFPFESIREVWGYNSIKQIAISINGKCPSDAYKPILHYDWPGLNEGCDCLNNNGGLNKKVFSGACSADQKAKGCIESKPMDGKEIMGWKDISNFLCVERFPDINMERMILNSDPSQPKCKPGFQMCPPAPVDPKSGKPIFSWAMCVPESMTHCPITLIKMAKCNENPDTNCFTDKLETVTKLFNDMCLWQSRRCGLGPISTLAVGEDAICRHLNDYQISEKHDDYPLLRKLRSKCLANPDTEMIDTMPQSQYLTQSGVVLKDAKGFEEHIKTLNYSLFSVYNTKWKWNHRHTDDIYLVFNNKAFIERLEHYHAEALEFFGIYVAICLIVAPALFYFEFKNPEMYRYNRILLCAKYSILWFFKIAAVPVVALLLKLNNDISKKFKDFGDAEFSNDYENRKMQQLAEAMEKGVYTWDKYALWLSCIVIVVDGILMYMTCTAEKYKIKTEDIDMDQSLADGVEIRVQ